MKYSDQQRIQKIYDNAVKLHDYIRENHISKEDLLKELSLQWLVTTPLYKYPPEGMEDAVQTVMTQCEL